MLHTPLGLDHRPSVPEPCLNDPSSFSTARLLRKLLKVQRHGQNVYLNIFLPGVFCLLLDHNSIIMAAMGRHNSILKAAMDWDNSNTAEIRMVAKVAINTWDNHKMPRVVQVAINTWDNHKVPIAECINSSMVALCRRR